MRRTHRWPMSTDRSNIDVFIDHQVQAGQRVDSGVFTLDSEQAWAKMASHALPYREAWVPKVVQAAVLAGCSELQVTQTAKSTVFTFVGGRGWDWEALIRAHAQHVKASVGAEAALCTALLWLAKGLGQPFTLAADQRISILSWSAEQIRWGQPVPLHDRELALEVLHNSSHLSGMVARTGAKLSSAIAKTLYEECYTSSVPIYIDTRHVAGMFRDPRVGKGTSRPHRPLAILVMKPNPELPGFRMSLAQEWESASPAELSIKLAIRAREAQPLHCHFGAVALLVAYCDQLLPSVGPSWVVWVQDGAIVDRRPLEIEGVLGVLLAVSAQGLRTDLSGFRLLDDDHYRGRLAAARASLANELGGFKEKVQKLEVQLPASDSGRWRAAAGWAALLVVLPAGLWMLYDAKRKARAENRVEQEMEVRYLSGLDHLIGCLQTP